MSSIPDLAAVRRTIAELPVETHQAGDRVLRAGTRTGKLLILEQGALEVLRDGLPIATVTQAGTVLGELAMLLDQPHTADVRALERSAFRVADAATFMRADPAAALYVALVMAERIDRANGGLIEARRQLDPAQRRGAIGALIDRIASSLRYDGDDGQFPWYSIVPAPLLAAVARLALETYEQGAVVLAAGSATGRLLILEDGALEVVRDGVRIGEVSVRGALLGELALLLDRPHTADVRARKPATLRVADASTFLERDPAAALYVASVLARRLDHANRALIELKAHLRSDQPRGRLAPALDRIAQSLRLGG